MTWLHWLAIILPAPFVLTLLWWIFWGLYLRFRKQRGGF